VEKRQAGEGLPYHRSQITPFAQSKSPRAIPLFNQKERVPNERCHTYTSCARNRSTRLVLFPSRGCLPSVTLVFCSLTEEFTSSFMYSPSVSFVPPCSFIKGCRRCSCQTTGLIDANPSRPTLYYMFKHYNIDFSLSRTDFSLEIAHTCKHDTVVF
jgi:hypothetical protein